MNIFDIINIPLGFIIRIAYNLTNNYAIALLLFSLIMQIVLSPLAIKQQKNQVRQAKLAPKVAAIRKKYAGRNDKATQQKMQNETMELYQRENYNPAGGCLPMLIQFPILISLYNVVQFPLRYICQLSTDVIAAIQKALDPAAELFKGNYAQITMTQHISNMSAEALESTMVTVGENTQSLAQILEGVNLPNFNLFGLDLSQIPQITWPLQPILIIPVIMLAVLYVSQIITKKFTYRDPQAEEAQNNLSMKIMMWAMPLLSFYISFQVSAAICLYWLYRNVFQVAQSFILAKAIPIPKYTAEDYKKAEKEFASSSEKKREKKKVRSLHRIDEEDYETPAPATTSASSKKSKAIEAAPVKKDDRAEEKSSEGESDTSKTENND